MQVLQLQVKFTLFNQLCQTVSLAIILLISTLTNELLCIFIKGKMKATPLVRAILEESEAKLEMKNFKPPSIFVWR